MAKKEEILEILCGESGPASQALLSQKLDEPISSFATQLSRMEKQGLLKKNEQKEYIITEQGRVIAERAAEAAESLGGGAKVDETLTPTEETLKTTEFQQFVEMGRITGIVPLTLIFMVANHVWRGGDFRDLVWVWKGLTDMGIRSDLAQRWWHSWRSYLRQGVPEELAGVVSVPQTAADKVAVAKGEAVGKGKRDYILGPNDTPLYVGVGIGDLDYDDAVKLAAIKAAGIARSGIQTQGGQLATPGTMADETIKIIKAVQELAGPQSKGKSYVVKPGEGGYIVEEVEEGKPTLIATPGQGGDKASSSFFVDSDGSVQELAAGKPIVVMKQVPAQSAPPKTYIVRQTAEGIVAEEHDLGKPIIINAPAPSTNMPAMMPFPVIGSDGQPVYDSEGKPVYANIEPMMKYMGFQSEQKRADERHSALIGLVQTVKENIPDGIQAILSTVAELKGGTEAKAPPELKKGEQQLFQCGDCKTQFSPPPGWAGQPLKCPGCEKEYSKEELMT